jgi:uncharacterized protein (TIGR02466 family)
MADVRRLFSTPFMLDLLPDADMLASLRSAVEAEHVRDPAGVRVSNVGGWHSNTRMGEWGGEAALRLARKTMAMADELTIDFKSPDKSRYGWHAEMWANIGGMGSANQYHTHPGSFWSAVAYVDDGYQGDADPALGGELQLLDPRMPMIRMTAPDLRLTDADGQLQHNEIAVRPRTGLIVLFPSWLLHAVRPFHGAGTRISIAVNLIAAPRQADPVADQPGAG